MLQLFDLKKRVCVCLYKKKSTWKWAVWKRTVFLCKKNVNKKANVENLTSIILEKRELLAFFIVVAFPNISVITEDANSLNLIELLSSVEQRYFKRFSVDFVLPAPESPVMIIDWEQWSTRIFLIALSATRKIC